MPISKCTAMAVHSDRTGWRKRPIPVTKSVTGRHLTATDAFIFSPFDPPSRPEVLPDLFDDFERCVAALEDGPIFVTTVDGRPCICARSESPRDLPFYALTPVLRDGRTDPGVVPGGRITRDLVAAFVSCQVPMYLRPPDWGVRSNIEELHDDGRFSSAFDVRVPLIDPIRDGGQWDDEAVLPLGVEFQDPWRKFFRPWEHLDGFFGVGDPNPQWMSRRKRPSRMSSSRGWWEVVGIHERGDPDYYPGMWPEPRTFTAYLGWPAYLLDVAGPLLVCEHCGTQTIAGRRYCDEPECRRERAALRRRASRQARRQLERRANQR